MLDTVVASTKAPVKVLKMVTVEKDEASEDIKQLSRDAATAIARALAATPAFKRISFASGSAGSYGKETDPSEEQIALVMRSSAIRSATILIREAYRQGGYDQAQTASDVAGRFFSASGMVYRLRVRQLANDHRTSNSKVPLTLDEVPRVWPDQIVLWTTPKLTLDAPHEGATAMIQVHRAELVDCAEDFFKSGILCFWFEKMVLEALIAAEYYATLKASMINATLWTGKASVGRNLAMGWAYEKSRGGVASYQLYLALAVAGLVTIQAAVFLGLLWWTFSSFSERPTWMNSLGLLVVSLSGGMWLGKLIVRTVVRWGQPQGLASKAFENHLFPRVLFAMHRVADLVQAHNMSTTLLREAVIEAWRQHVDFDPIIIPYLDRASSANEYLWTRDER